MEELKQESERVGRRGQGRAAKERRRSPREEQPSRGRGGGLEEEVEAEEALRREGPKEKRPRRRAREHPVFRIYTWSQYLCAGGSQCQDTSLGSVRRP